jgi:hypothetical protein
VTNYTTANPPWSFPQPFPCGCRMYLRLTKATR